ncbi:TetR family transcriptional regulator [Kribbella voronezhensis]|uniref:TetR family transcriptional regulator n=1 Tax=Kribbella voronezhensis TaxID=2512212 RepID=A0A4R7TB47_9ACTN|nr:TetR/AcrR family transcriptional regulator [Kribbella voronezhensis]TDU89241.1 TetR family transcriptional regulator [Kribbella voronezhensis]
MDSRLLAVATELLDQDGWTALSLDRIAERAGVSRATVWRAGLTRANVELVLRRKLAADYQELMWHPLTMPGSGLDRLQAALRSLCAVAERNLPLLAHTDLAFHEPDLDAAGLELDYFGPWLRILEQAAADGSLPPVDNPTRFVVALTDALLLTYVHLRAHHSTYGWTPDSTADHLITLLTHGYLPRSG